MKFSPKTFALVVCAAFLIGPTTECGAFALLGPVQPWMQSTNGVINAGDIGGPMLLTNEYRWNVPVVTYGFDKSFTDYFGTNGVAAVEGAIQILNNLPPASQMVLTNYPLESQSYNPDGEGYRLYDLKSSSLALLLEQLGLAQPTRHTFVLRRWDAVLAPPTNGFSTPYNWPDWVYPDFVSPLNFDPRTFAPSFFVNTAEYAAYITSFGNQNSIYPFPVAPGASPVNSAVADFDLQLGGFYTGLTYDDVGGLAYLLSANNINYETMIAGVVGTGTNANAFVNGAWRPGVEKILFRPQPVGPSSGTFLPTTNYFTDRFFSNGIVKRQALARIISQPDFLFSAEDMNTNSSQLLIYSRTGTTNWLNHAAANGDTNGAGPGVIQSRVQIVFDKIGPSFASGTYFIYNGSDETVLPGWYFYNSIHRPNSWASFDGSTNPPVIYPIAQTGTNQMTVRLRLIIGDYPHSTDRVFEWKPTSVAGMQFTMQTSTNLTSWVPLFDVVNDGSVVSYYVIYPTSRSRFYRLIPQ